MKTRSNKKKSLVSAPPARSKTDSLRCGFTSTDGRRCLMPRVAKHATLCLSHARQEREFDQAGQDLSQELASLSGNLKTASDVYQVLRKVFSLLAQRRISRRDAIAFAYIAQLVLQTLPGVKREMQIALGQEAWEQTLEAAVGVSDTDQEEEQEEKGEEENEEDETTEAGDSDEIDESGTQPQGSEIHTGEPSSQPVPGRHPVPQNLAELATMILARHVRSNPNSRPAPGSAEERA